MDYKTLLTVLTDDTIAAAQLDQAAGLANACDAHLDILCLGVDRTQYGYYYGGPDAVILQETLTQAENQASGLRDLAKDRMARAGDRWSTSNGVVQLSDIGRHVAYRARFADLVIAPRPYGEGRGPELVGVVEAAMFEGRVPVLVMPDAARLESKPKTVLVAWNESVEAMAAIRKSLPFLVAADTVRITVIDPPQHDSDRSDPGAMLGQMPARHGAKCEIDVLSNTMYRVSDVLNRHATDTDADMIVMGAYGHSRFRQSILGGATRSMLEKAAVPVLMAH